MVVVITPAAPHSIVGPGLPLQLELTPPLPGAALWQVFVSTLPGPGLTTWLESWPVIAPLQRHALGTGTVTIPGTQELGAALRDEDAMHVTAVVKDAGGLSIDSGQLDSTWEATAGIGALQVLLGEQNRGLDQVQAQQLEEVHASVFPSISLDSLALAPLTSGPAGGVVSAFLPNWCFGVLVRISSVPPELSAGTPDGDYWFPDLAVVRIFRASDLWIRAPVHTSSKIVSLAGEGVIGAIASLATSWLLQMSVQVSFREGVTGEVFLMRLP